MIPVEPTIPAGTSVLAYPTDGPPMFGTVLGSVQYRDGPVYAVRIGEAAIGHFSSHCVFAAPAPAMAAPLCAYALGGTA
jgi:hypothetical protein